MPLLSSLPSRIVIPLLDVLSTYDRRAQGVMRGWEGARRALKDREAQIVELQAKIEMLEAEREEARRAIASPRRVGKENWRL